MTQGAYLRKRTTDNPSAGFARNPNKEEDQEYSAAGSFQVLSSSQVYCLHEVAAKHLQFRDHLTTSFRYVENPPKRAMEQSIPLKGHG